MNVLYPNVTFITAVFNICVQMSNYVWPYPNKKNILWSLASSLTIKLGAIFSKTLLYIFNDVTIHNKSILLNVLQQRFTKPVITFSNHYSCMDDPGLWGILPWTEITRDKMRWALGAYDILFTTYRHRILFSLGKVIPIVRGDGVYQKGMDFCIDQLNSNKAWVHIFPEGKVNINKEYLRFKWGIGRIIAECKNVPIILPFFHIGMDKVLPNHKPYIPRIGKKVTIFIGDPINISDLLKQLKSHKLSQVEMRKQITDFLQQEFFAFRRKIELKHNLSSTTTSSS